VSTLLLMGHWDSGSANVHPSGSPAAALAPLSGFKQGLHRCFRSTSVNMRWLPELTAHACVLLDANPSLDSAQGLFKDRCAGHRPLAQ